MAPSYLLTMAGVAFYEHPTMGDEAPMMAKVDGVFYDTEFWDEPEAGEVLDMLEQINAGDFHIYTRSKNAYQQTA